METSELSLKEEAVEGTITTFRNHRSRGNPILESSISNVKGEIDSQKLSKAVIRFIRWNQS